MTRKQKLIERLFGKPKDFKWSELKALLISYGYTGTQGKGSRIKFYNQEKDSLLVFHKPHPGNTLKQYIIDDTITKFEDLGIKP